MEAYASVECKDIDQTSKAVQELVVGSLIKKAAEMAKEKPVLFIAANMASFESLMKEAREQAPNIYIEELRGNDLVQKIFALKEKETGLFLITPWNVVGQNFLFKGKGGQTISPCVFAGVLPLTFRQLYQWAGRSERDHTKPSSNYKLFVSETKVFDHSIEVTRIVEAIRQTVQKYSETKNLTAFNKLKVDNPPALKK